MISYITKDVEGHPGDFVWRYILAHARTIRRPAIELVCVRARTSLLRNNSADNLAATFGHCRTEGPLNSAFQRWYMTTFRNYF